MSTILSIALTIPTSLNVPGAFAAMSAFGASRQLQYNGAAGDVILLEGTSDNGHVVTLGTYNVGAKFVLNLSNTFTGIRATRLAGTTSATCVITGEPVIGEGPTGPQGPAGAQGAPGPTGPQGDPGPPTLGNLPINGNITESTGDWATINSYTPEQDGIYSIFWHVNGRSADALNGRAIIALATVLRSGGVLSLLENNIISLSPADDTPFPATTQVDVSSGTSIDVQVNSNNAIAVTWQMFGVMNINPIPPS